MGKPIPYGLFPFSLYTVGNRLAFNITVGNRLAFNTTVGNRLALNVPVGNRLACSVEFVNKEQLPSVSTHPAVWASPYPTVLFPFSLYTVGNRLAFNTTVGNRLACSAQ